VFRRKGIKVAERFQLAYDGPATEGHEMDVRHLAPALFATGSIFQRMNAIQFPDNPPVAVNIRATREGSVDVELALVVVGAGVKLLASPEMTAAANLATLLGGFGKLIEYIKFRSGKEIASEEEVAPGEIAVRTTDGAEMTITAPVKAFSEDVTIRHDVAEVVRPLGLEEYERVRYKSEQFSVGITSTEAPAFAAIPELPEARKVHEEEREMVLRAPRVWFQRGNKWKVTDGENEFSATVTDESFMADVVAGRIALTSKDLFRCRVKVIQKLDAEGELHGEYEIVEVLAHMSRPQMRLFEGGGQVSEEEDE
jgi:hypothetical protein